MDPTKLFGKVNKDLAVDAAAQAEFNEKKRVWIPDATEGFLAGWVKSEPSAGDAAADATAEVVVSATGEMRTVPTHSLSPMNPPQFDGVEDIAELTHLNEASVVNNSRSRYGAGSIYSYSGLFLISLNPYRPLPIYTSTIVSQYRSKRREENPPHIFAVAERAWQQIGEERESQSISITGESGAGKTENTKKVIQYLAAIANTNEPSSSGASAPLSGLPRSSSFKGRAAEELSVAPRSDGELGSLERQISQANPILESFGNAQTMRNNNSSRFGKFVRIFFSPSGAIAGANIDWYLSEKSRVTQRAAGERNFHVFYQLSKGAKEAGFADRLSLTEGPEKFDILNKTRLEIDGVDDSAEWRLSKEALDVVGFSEEEQFELFRIIAIISHIGNIGSTATNADQALMPPESQPVVEKVCHLLGISDKEFMKSVSAPKVRAGREWVTYPRSKKQAEDESGASSKFMFERTFGGMVSRINKALDRPNAKSLSIGVLDIAGFEIFEENSYEQSLINFTNEKSQQFFNFHMFTLEQEEYTREGIKWDYVNFGLDLQPTIELIESAQQPVGIMSMLDEECIMPRATDITFNDKVQASWEPPKGSTQGPHPGSAKFKATRFSRGFVIKHYAGDVEYVTEGWSQKNKDPINDATARLASQSTVPAIKTMFHEYAEDATTATAGKRVKRGAFRTVGQRHKEQSNQLMSQLASTQPHFVRCIVPNSEKKPGKVEVNLVLDQLRCNGVIEGIRIARLGYPNRSSFAEFRQRYEVLVPGVVPQGYMDGRKATGLIAEALELDPDFYAIGATKIFFKAGILAELEERRDNSSTDIFRRFQSAARMHICRRRINKSINRAQAVRAIQRNARAYISLRDWPWWSLYVKVRPSLAATKVDDELSVKRAELAMIKERAERDEAEKKRLEESKIALLSEKEKVEADSLAERDLAVEKDEMSKRAKEHEAQLQERVAELEAESEKVETARSEVSATGEKQRDALTKSQHKHDQLAQQISMLEKNESSWRNREAELLRTAKDRTAAHTKLENDKLAVERQLEDLRRDIGTKDEATRRAADKKASEISELQKSLAEEKKKVEMHTTKAESLQKDLQSRDVASKDSQEMIKAHEATLMAKSQAIADLEGKHSASVKAHEATESARAASQTKAESLASEIAARDRQIQKDAAERATLEKSLDELRKVMDAKANEDVKRREVEKSREAEMASSRQQVASSHQSQEKQRENAIALANKSRVDIDASRQRHSTAEKNLAASNDALKAKTSEAKKLEGAAEAAHKAKRAIEADSDQLKARSRATEGSSNGANSEVKNLQARSKEKDQKFADLEDASLPLEHERQVLRKRSDETSTHSAKEIATRQALEKSLSEHQEEIANHRNELTQFERELAQAAADIKARDDEVALMRSRENKTIVEHVHVLESAKKMTDRQLVEQVSENKKSNQISKSMETHRNRLQADLEDSQRSHDMSKKERSREARAGRASLGPADVTSAVLEEERKARAAAEAKAASLERDLADIKRRQSTAPLNPSSPKRSVSSSSEGKLARASDEITRSQKSLDAVSHENRRLGSELASSRQKNDLSQQSQQSHDALGRDMSDQSKRLDSSASGGPRRQANGHGHGHAQQASLGSKPAFIR